MNIQEWKSNNPSKSISDYYAEYGTQPSSQSPNNQSNNVSHSYTKNVYYEYRKWTIFWGFFIDGEVEIKKAIEKYNSQGYSVVQFEWGSTKMSIFKQLWIYLVTILTLGILTYYVGFIIIFEKKLN